MVEAAKDKNKKDGLVLQVVVVSGIVLISCLGGFLAIDKMSGPSCGGGATDTTADVRAARALYDAMTSRLLMEKRARLLVDTSDMNHASTTKGEQKPILTIKVVISKKSIAISQEIATKGDVDWNKVMKAAFLKFLELLGISERDITDVNITRVTFEPDDKVEVVCQIYLQLNNVVFGKLKWFGIPFSDGKAFAIFFKKLASDLFHDALGLEMSAFSIRCEESSWKKVKLAYIQEIKPPEDINEAFHMKPYRF